MKRTTKYISFLLFTLPALFILSACIDEYEHPGVKEIGNILVVDGKITSDSTIITLSRSVGLSQAISDTEVIANATIWVERIDGVTFNETVYRGNGIYFIPIENLQKGKKYRLYIKIEENEYVSEYLDPFFTPEIEELSWEKKNGLVSFHISTSDPENQTNYYQWSYIETWEFHTELFASAAFLNASNGPIIDMDLYSENNRYYCWNYGHSNKLIIGSSIKLQENIIDREKIAEFDPKSERFMTMYHLKVSQCQIRKSTYDYYYNLQKNIEEVGSIFTPIPSELHGNIVNKNNPDEIVIGCVDVATTTYLSKYFPLSEGIYEPSYSTCEVANYYVEGYGIVDQSIPMTFAPLRCVDCRVRGTKQRPSDWPTDHY